MLKMYQDKLGDIQDYEVLINGIKKYCKKRKLEEDDLIDVFEHDQNTLIENFDNQIELFIAVCRDVLNLNKNVARVDISVDLKEFPVLTGKKDVDKNDEVTTEAEKPLTKSDDVSRNVSKIVESINDYVKMSDIPDTASIEVDENKDETTSEEVSGSVTNITVDN